MLLALSLAFGADERESWKLLYDALLQEAAYGDVSTSVGAYEQLARNLGPDDQVRADALYWLGAAAFADGDHERAKSALVDGLRTGLCPVRCKALLAETELVAASIRTVPVEFLFDDPQHPVFHPWSYQDQGTIRLLTGESGLLWETTVQPRRPDQLVIGFEGTTPAPQQVALTVESRDLDAVLQVAVVDVHDQQFAPALPFRIPAGTERQIVVDLTRLRSDGGGDAFDPRQISRLFIADVTGIVAGSRGQNRFVLHRVGVR